MTTTPRALAALALALAALGGCKDEPPPAKPVPDAAPPDAARLRPTIVDPDGGPPDAEVPDASTDAQVLVGSTTIIKLTPATPAGGAKNPPPKPPGPTAGVSIMGTIRKHQNEVIDCYARVAESRPEIAGQLTMTWTLGGDGKPTMAAVARNTMGDASVGTCVKNASLKWQFPKPAGGTSVVKYTWTLRMQ